MPRAGRSSTRSARRRDGRVVRVPGGCGPAGSASWSLPAASARSWRTARRPNGWPERPPRGVVRRGRPRSTCRPTRCSASRSALAGREAIQLARAAGALVSLDLASVGPLLADGRRGRPRARSGTPHRTCCSRRRSRPTAARRAGEPCSRPGRPGADRRRQARRGRRHRPRPRRTPAGGRASSGRSAIKFDVATVQLRRPTPPARATRSTPASSPAGSRPARDTVGPAPCAPARRAGRPPGRRPPPVGAAPRAPARMTGYAPAMAIADR